MLGYWNAEDNGQFIAITIEDDGQCHFGHAWWASEGDMIGYLQQPVTGDPDGIVSIHLYYEGLRNDATGVLFPALDEDALFDLSRIDEGVIGWKHDGAWEYFRYGGATMEEAAPRYE